ncbi:hypothetical protein K502DRAFT_363947 [Neoconidiobolus thromboides FSU 785]|nr:hypothetical protein K502DRAFT_363947 [Neoconidiobolus thromboides FSU 785]
MNLELQNTILKFGLFWVVAYVLKYCFKFRWFLKIKKRIQRYIIIELNFFEIVLSTTIWNQIIQKLSKNYQKVWTILYKLGTYFSYPFFIYSIYLFFNAYIQFIIYFYYYFNPIESTLSNNNNLIKRSFIYNKEDNNSNNQTQFIIKPIIPGVTLPSNDVVIYLFSFLVSGVIHEVGHAIASEINNINIERIAIIIKYIYSGAYVEINNFQFNKLKNGKKLMIIIAGIINNLLFYIILYMINYWQILTKLLLFFNLYSMNLNTVLISNIKTNSPLINHLNIGDRLLNVNDVNINNLNDWNNLVMNNNNNDNNKLYNYDGVCINSSILNTVNITSCCNNNDNSNNDLTCFKQIDSIEKNSYCLSPFIVFNESKRCNINNPCNNKEKKCIIDTYPIGSKYHWFRLNVNRNNNNNKITTITNNDNKLVLYYGDFQHLDYYIQLTDLNPNFVILSYLLPETINNFLLYLMSFNLALAFFNILPIYSCDGDLFLLTNLKLMESYFDKKNRLNSVNNNNTSIEDDSINEDINNNEEHNYRNDNGNIEENRDIDTEKLTPFYFQLYKSIIYLFTILTGTLFILSILSLFL